MSERVRVFDTTLRDGEQAAGVCFSARDKVEIAEQLDAMGVDVIEAGFPVNSPGEAAAVEQVALEVQGAAVCALARAIPKDVAIAGNAIRHAAHPRLHVFVNASDMHLAHQLQKTREQVVTMSAAMVENAREFTDDVEFSPMDATRSDPAFLADLVRATVRAGATTINLPDTVGYATPEQVAAMFKDVAAKVPEIEAQGVVLSFHGQDDLGMATANTLAAVGAGARQVEVAVNGIGERAGNTAFEEVVSALHVHGARLGVHTGVDMGGIWRLSKEVERRSGIGVPLNKAVVGGNAFRHASGIHQDGVLKHRETYEVLDPASIGHPTGTEIVLGKLSGRNGFAERVAALGFGLDDAEVEQAFRHFQGVAAQQPFVDDEGLRKIVAATAPGR